MAEFCLDCWNRLNGRKDTEREYVLTYGIDICERCGKYKRVILRKRYIPALYTLRQKLGKK